jgi:plastocyanin
LGNTIIFANIVFLLFGIIGIDMFKTDSGYAQSSKDILSDHNLGQAKIILTSHKYVENKDSNYGDIVGQVKNIGNGIAESVEIIFTYYDYNGEIVGTDSTYIDIQRLKPDQKAPFSQYINKNTTQGLTNYEIALKWNNPDGSEEYIENAKITKEEKKPSAISKEKEYSNGKQLLLSDNSTMGLVDNLTSQYIGENYNRSKSLMLSDQEKIIPSSNQSTQDSTDTKKWLEYASPIYDFSLEYPENWKIVEGNRFMNIPGLIVPANVNTTNINTVFANYSNYDNGIVIFGEIPLSLKSLSVTDLSKHITERIIGHITQNTDENGFSNWQIFEITPARQLNGNNVISAIFLVGDPVKDKSSLVLESLFIPYDKKLYSFIFMGTPYSFDQSNVLENRKHIFNSIKLSNTNNNINNNNKIQLPSNPSLPEGEGFLNLQNDMQLNVPDKVTTPQQRTNTTSESTELQPQQITTDVTLTILQGSSIQGNPDYDPKELTVKKGDKIVVDNVDTMPHTVTNGESGSDPNSGKLFDTSIINGGDSAEIVTSNIDAGTYPYYCTVHPYMIGSVTIK